MALRRRINEIRGYKCITIPVRQMGIYGSNIRIDLLRLFKKDGTVKKIYTTFYRNIKRSNWIFIPRLICELYGIEKGDIIEFEITPVTVKR